MPPMSRSIKKMAQRVHKKIPVVYYGICDCGWYGPDARMKRHAEADCVDHQQQCHPQKGERK